MANTATIGIEVDSTQVKEATVALDEFAKAADCARDALERLGRGFAAESLAENINDLRRRRAI